ncbi:hypothetical protein, partial [Rhizobium sp. Leaf321]|uniref:hypothetical protein n=1 Tax=Rhizobium sp. Leaf321 TaxID=1736335 RepID=UPI001AEBEDF8
ASYRDAFSNRQAKKRYYSEDKQRKLRGWMLQENLEVLVHNQQFEGRNWYALGESNPSFQNENLTS